MLAKCANPSCSASFRYLYEGRLFRLDTFASLRSSNLLIPEYFWLCGRCSPVMTLRLGENGKVVAALSPERVHAVPSDVAQMSMDRRDGLLLTRVSFTREGISEAT
jgi:hypothetical protein